MNKALQSSDQPKKIRGVIAKVVRSGGVVASNPKEGLKVVTDYIADKIEGNASASLLQGLEYLNKKGNVGSDFLESPENRHFTLLIRRAISTGTYDEMKLRYKIELYLAIASGEVAGNELEKRRIWGLIDSLNDFQLGVLAACSKLAKSHQGKGPYTKKPSWDWLDLIAKESGLTHREFVEEAERSLVNDNLLEERSALDEVFLEPNYRLTRLGLLVAEYLEKGRQIIEASS